MKRSFSIVTLLFILLRSSFRKHTPLVLIVYCHYINLCITVIIIQPVRTDTGRNKRNFFLFAYTCKYILTYVLICKCHEFLNKPPYNKLDYDKFIYITYSFTRKSRSFMRSVYNPAILQKPLRIAQSYSKSPLSNHFDFLEIADKILPYYKAWYDSCPECEYLLHTEDWKHFEYRNYYDSYFKPLMEQLNINRTPHCCRHTCISMLAGTGIN